MRRRPVHLFARRPLLAPSLACIAFMLAGGATAEEAAPAAANSGDDIQTITVSGIRASLEKAIDIKRNAEAFVDAISAEDIGKFPDKNAAESLSRIPGITITHDFGDGEQVSIEGTDPSLNRTLLNGQTAASGSWYYSDVQYPTRAFNYTLLPSPVVGDLEVYKSPEARIDEGSLGGTVIIHLRNPLDMAPFTTTIAVDGNYNQLANKPGEDLSALTSWHNDKDTFGVSIAFVRNDEHYRRDGIETFGYSPVQAQLPDGSFLANGANLLVPDGINSSLFQQERLSTGGTFSAQYQPTDRWKAELNLFYNFAQYDNSDQSFYIQPVTVTNNGILPINSGTVKNGTLFSADVPAPAYPTGDPTNPRNTNVANNSVEHDQFVRTASVQTIWGDFKLSYKGDDWKASVEGGYTRARTGMSEYTTEFVGDYAFNYDLSGGIPKFGIPFNPTDNSALTYYYGTYDGLHALDDETFAQADFSHGLAIGPFNQILAGVKYRDHTNWVTGFVYDNANTDPNWPANPSYNGTVSSSGLVPSNHLSSLGATGIPAVFPNVDPAKQKAFINNGTLINIGSNQSNFAVHEKTSAGYVEAMFGTDQLHGNIGVRYVHTDQQANFFNVASLGATATPLNPLGLDFVNTPVAVSHPYNDIQPSLNIAYDVAKDDVLRAAVARVMARNNYGDLAGSVNLNPTNLTGTRGNPDLLPYRSTNFSLSNEYYMGKNGLFEVAAFYKEIQSYVTQVTATEYYTVPGFPGNNPYQVTYPTNGGGGHAEGFEVQAQHDVWGGFGAIGSYTYAFAGLDTGGPLPGNSRHAFTLTGYYEDEALSARLSYTYRTDWYVLHDVVTPQYHAGEGELDFAANYNLTKNVSLSFDAINLLDLESEYYDGTPANPVYLYKNGRRFRFGTKVTF